MSFLEDAVGNIGRELAKTAVDSLSQSTGVDVGGTLAYLFSNGQPEGGASMEALIQAVNEKFAGDPAQLALLQADRFQQSQALAALGVQLNAISAALASITGQIQNIEEMLKSIGQEQLYQNWQNVDNHLTNYLAAIDSAYSTYGDYVSAFKTTPTIEVTDLIEEILDVNVGPKVGLTAIYQFLMGDGEQRGALQLWSLMVTPLVQRGLLDYRLAVQQYFQYYEKLTYAQLKAANLLMEAYNFNHDPTQAKKAWKQYRTQLLSQEDTFVTWLVPLVYAGVQGGVFASATASSTIVNFTAFDAAMQLNPGVQYVRGDARSVGDAFYTPSSVFMAAEQLLASLYVTGSSDRRIVVHMLYANGGGLPTLLSSLPLTLSRIGSRAPIGAVSRSRLGGPFPFPTLDDRSPAYPDQNIYEGDGFFLNRYVFVDSDGGGLTDGQYTLSDLNGHDGLVPMETYLASEDNLPPAPFQQHSVVSYTLEVNTANPFDFMNFAAYTVPTLYPG